MCDNRTASVFVSEGSERVKTATLSFKLNYGLVLRLELSPLGRVVRAHSPPWPTTCTLSETIDLLSSKCRNAPTMTGSVAEI